MQGLEYNTFTLSIRAITSINNGTPFDLQGLEYDEAAKRLWILDAKGLITKHRPAEELSDVQRPFAAVGDDDKEGENLLDVVKRVGCSKSFL